MSVLPQIETIVVLMVENRSLDTMLGWLHEGDKNIKIVPQGSQPDRFDGIVPGMSNSAYSDTYAPRRGSPGLGSQRWRVPREDPAESMRNVADQMYADGSGDRQGRTWADNAPMTGFAWDYLRMFPPVSLGRDGCLHRRRAADSLRARGTIRGVGSLVQFSAD